jgi:photosystem II stability/assembly factor-like uncharacterized protein
MSVVRYSFLFFLFFMGVLFAQWKPSTSGLPSSWTLGMALDAYSDSVIVIAISESPSIYITTNMGNNWEGISDDHGVMDVSIVDPQHIWFATDIGAIFATLDKGAHWTRQFFDTSKTSFMNFIQMFDLQNGVAMGDGKSALSPAVFLRTSDGGTHWTSVNDSAFGAFSGDLWRRVSFVSPLVGYFFESGTNPQSLYKTTDGGESWKSVLTVDGSIGLIKFYSNTIGFAVHPVNNNIYRTTDGGTIWETFTTPFSGWPNDIEFIKGDPSQVWAVSGSVYFSNDTGRTWITQLDIKGRDLAFLDAMHGWLLSDTGVYYTVLGPVLGVNSQWKISQIRWALEQNYPNPFNPITTIAFTLPSKSFVTLKVYDLLGREVSTLVDEELSAGKYLRQWNASNFSSGVYFYQLQTGSFTETKKLFLLK